jgi:hypothetical protein
LLGTAMQAIPCAGRIILRTIRALHPHRLRIRATRPLLAAAPRVSWAQAADPQAFAIVHPAPKARPIEGVRISYKTTGPRLWPNGHRRRHGVLSLYSGLPILAIGAPIVRRLAHFPWPSTCGRSTNGRADRRQRGTRLRQAPWSDRGRNRNMGASLR